MVVSRAINVAQKVVFFFVALHFIRKYRTKGLKGILSTVTQAVKLIPGVESIIKSILDKEVKSAIALLTAGDGDNKSGKATKALKVRHRRYVIPAKGVNRTKLLRDMKQLQGKEHFCDEGRAFALVYFSENQFAQHSSFMGQVFKRFEELQDVDGEQNEFVANVYRAFMHGNALNPTAFPSLRKFEVESISMVASMLNGDENVVGAMTSGGTESIMMAVKAHRNRARKLRPFITEPEMLCPVTIHPAFDKAGHYFDVKVVHVPLNEEGKVTAEDMKKYITKNTILICASAPQYCHCLVDPIPDISKLAEDFGLPLHVDACYGGFVLPFIEQLSKKYPSECPLTFPPFDFRNSGVASMTADIHKYGFCPKGSSFILFRTPEFREYMYYAYAKWPGGMYASPSMAGTRPGANIAMAWATLMSLGQEGYCDMVRKLLATAAKLKNGLADIPNVVIMHKENVYTGFSIKTEAPIDILAVADAMETKGWKIERQQFPTCIHVSVMPQHIETADEFVVDFRDAVKKVRDNKISADEGTAAMYGMVGNINSVDSSVIDDFLLQFFGQIYRTELEPAEKKEETTH